MQGAKGSGWLWALPLLLSACIGQDSWSRWASVHHHPELAPMRRMHLVVEDGWWSRGSDQSDEYRAALVDALARRGILLDEDAENVDATLMVRPWVRWTRSGGRGSSATNSAGVDIRIHRVSDGQRVFAGRFIGGPGAAANAIADLVVLGRVGET